MFCIVYSIVCIKKNNCHSHLLHTAHWHTNRPQGMCFYTGYTQHNPSPITGEHSFQSDDWATEDWPYVFAVEGTFIQFLHRLDVFDTDDAEGLFA